MGDAVLTVNAGSSSLKFSVYRTGEDGRPGLSAKGQVEGIGTSPHLIAEDAQGQTLVDRRWPVDADPPALDQPAFRQQSEHQRQDRVVDVERQPRAGARQRVL